MANNSALIIIGVIIVVLIIGVLVFLGYNKSPSATTTIVGTSLQNTTTVQNTTVNKSSNIPVMITDPPVVPAGTQDLVVAYTSLMVHTSSTGRGAHIGWVNVSGSGSLDLLTVVNSSKVIGLANISANSSINFVKLDIASMTITVNGIVYNVTLPSNSILIAITGSEKINSTSGVLVDFEPVVHAVYNDNTTSFIMAPVVRAAVVSNVTGVGLGARIGLDASAKARLEAATPNITITNASVTVSGNDTSVSITVKDNSNSSAVISDVVLQGKQNAVVSRSTGLNTSVLGSVNSVLNGNGSSKSEAHASVLEDLGLNIEDLNQLGFVVSPEGSLALPTDAASIEDSGYTLNQGASATFTFNGVVSYNSGKLYAAPEAGSQQQITVVGEDGAHATTTVIVG